MTQELYQRFYEIEEDHWWFVASRNIILHMVKELLPRDSQETSRILDLGCGTGGTLLHLNKLAPTEGLEPNKQAIHYCQSRGLSVTEGVAESIPWDDGTFDSVVMADVLEHCANDRDSLQEVFRILKENGQAVITVPAYAWLWSGHDTANHHYRRYSKQELRQKLLASGFVIEKITYYNTFLFPFVVLTRGIKKVLRRTGSDLTMPPAIINKFLAAVFDSEKVILSRGGVFPFGVSLLCVVRRPMTNKV